MDQYLALITDSYIIINRIAELLNKENIPFIIKDNVESARLAGFGSSINNVKLSVQKSDYKKALQVLDSFKHSQLNKEEE